MDTNKGIYLLMPSKKAKVQIRFEDEDYQYLEEWAKEEFSTLTQLCRSIILKAVASRKKDTMTRKDSP